MSVLSDAVQARYSVEKMVQLTNPDVPNATTVDTTRLLAACDDVIADFDLVANTTFDDTDSRHVKVAIEGVILTLQMRQLNVDPSELREQWDNMLERLGQSIGGRTKTEPTTDAVAVPSDESSESGETVRPLFDRTRFDKLVPNSPGSADRQGLPEE